MKWFSLVLAILCFAAPAHAQSLNAEITAAHRAAQKYLSVSAAKRAGWRGFGGDEPLMGIHYQNSNAPDYVLGDRIDPARPSNLMFTDINGKTALVALSYNVRIRPGDPLPAGFTGTRDVWHVHNFEDAIAAATLDRPFMGWIANAWLDGKMRQDGRTRVAMVHLWLIPNPEGQFATHNPVLAYLDHGLPADWADGMAAARGVALGTPNGCDEALNARYFLANVPRRTQRQINRLCESLARDVRAAIPQGKEALNTAGRRADAQLSSALDKALTSQQKARIAAIVEHGSSHGN